MVDAGERLQVLLRQEATNYQTCDYLSRMQGLVKAQENFLEAVSEAGHESSSSDPSSPKKRKSWEDLTSVSQSDASQHTEQCRRTASTTCASSAGGASVGSSSTTSQINKHWREKICEWAYQGTSSESKERNRNLDPLNICHSLCKHCLESLQWLITLILTAKLLAQQWATWIGSLEYTTEVWTRIFSSY